MIEEGRPERRTVVTRKEVEDEISEIELSQRRLSPGTAFLVGRQHSVSTHVAAATPKPRKQEQTSAAQLQLMPAAGTRKRHWAVTSSADVKSAALDYQLYFKFLSHISYNQWNEGRLYFTALHKQFAPAGKLNDHAISTRVRMNSQLEGAGCAAQEETPASRMVPPKNALSLLCLKAAKDDPDVFLEGKLCTRTQPAADVIIRLNNAVEFKITADGLAVEAFKMTAGAVNLLNTSLKTQSRDNYVPVYMSWQGEQTAYSSSDFKEVCDGVKAVCAEGVYFYFPECIHHPIILDPDCEICSTRCKYHKPAVLKVTADMNTLWSLAYPDGFTINDEFHFCPDCDITVKESARCVWLDGDEEEWNKAQEGKAFPWALFGVVNAIIIMCALHMLIRCNSRLLSLTAYALWHSTDWLTDAEYEQHNPRHKPDGTKMGGDTLVAEFCKRVAKRSNNSSFNIVNKGENWWKPTASRGDHALKFLAVVPQVIAELLPAASPMRQAVISMWTLFFQIVWIASYCPQEHLAFFIAGGATSIRDCHLQRMLDQLALIIKTTFTFKRGNNQNQKPQINFYL